MAYENFKPTVWAKKIQRELEKLCVMQEDCNTQWQGNVGIGKRCLLYTSFLVLPRRQPDSKAHLPDLQPRRRRARVGEAAVYRPRLPAGRKPGRLHFYPRQGQRQRGAAGA